MPKVNKANCATRYLEQKCNHKCKETKTKEFQTNFRHKTKTKRSDSPVKWDSPSNQKKTVKENASYRNCSIAIHTFCNGYSMSYIFVVLVNF